MKSVFVIVVLVAAVTADYHANEEIEDLKKEIKMFRQYVVFSREQDRHIIKSLKDEVQDLRERYEDLHRKYKLKHTVTVEKRVTDTTTSPDTARPRPFLQTHYQNRLPNGTKDILNRNKSTVASIQKVEQAAQAKIKRVDMQAGSIPRPAFYVCLSKTQSNLGDGQVIHFDNILTNSGNNYNKHSRSFTCNRAGMYIFTWSISVNPGKYVATSLTQNGVVRGALGVAGSSQHWNTGSQTVILSLDVGDVVQVRVETESASHDDGASLSDSSSTFSGFLLL